MNTFRKYTYIKYEYGWMVISIDVEGNDEQLVSCYIHEADAVSHAKHLNEAEPNRVAAEKTNMENALKSIFVHSNPNYSITGYFGD